MKCLVVAITAWPKTDYRLAYLLKTIESIRRCVIASGIERRLLVSCESADVSREMMQATVQECHLKSVGVYWREEPPSLGLNANRALELAKNLGASHILLSQDDWEWHAPVHVANDMAFLDEHPEYALIRYATYYTKFTGSINERLLDVWMDGPYQYGDQPHLRRASFDREFGWYADGEGDYGLPERDLADRLRIGNWKIAAYSPNVLEHCGSLSTAVERQQVNA